MKRLSVVCLAAIFAGVCSTACEKKTEKPNGAPGASKIQDDSPAAEAPVANDKLCSLAPPSQVASVLGLPPLSLKASPGRVTACEYETADKKIHLTIRFQEMKPNQSERFYRATKKAFKNPQDLSGVGDYAFTDTSTTPIGKSSITTHLVAVWKGSTYLSVVSTHNPLDKQVELTRQIVAKL